MDAINLLTIIFSKVFSLKEKKDFVYYDDKSALMKDTARMSETLTKGRGSDTERIKPHHPRAGH